MNGAAILAARRDAKELGQIDLTNAVEKVMIGPERQSHLMGKQEKVSSIPRSWSCIISITFTTC